MIKTLAKFTKKKWRKKVFYDGVGPLKNRHATVYKGTAFVMGVEKSGYMVDCLVEFDDGTACSTVYGEVMPLTEKMADDVARRFIEILTIPRRLNWR
jgi:hypothetical protein